MNLLVVGFLFFLIFGLFGVSYFKGSFYRCTTNDLEDYDYEYKGLTATTLCIPKTDIPAERVVEGSARWAKDYLPFVSQCPEATPSEELKALNYTIWKRPTRDTPICLLTCWSEMPFANGQPVGDSEAFSFCQETRPWGHNVMRCTDCEAKFCAGNVNAEDRATGTEHCKQRDANYYCQEEDSSSDADGGRAGCLEECIASCACQKFCKPAAQDAALCMEQGGRWVYLNQNFDTIIV